MGWIDREYAGENAAGVDVSDGDIGVVGDGAADFEATGYFLGMIAVGAGIKREIGWAAEDEVEALVGIEYVWVAEIALADVVTA